MPIVTVVVVVDGLVEVTKMLSWVATVMLATVAVVVVVVVDDDDYAGTWWKAPVGSEHLKDLEVNGRISG
jgi:hypothetical protein